MSKHELKTQKNTNLSKIALMGDQVDFSGLFKLDVLVHLDITAYSFYEVGLKKFFAFSSNKELIFIYLNPQSGRLEKNYDWDFVDNPIYCMCFEPSGTWVLIISEQKVLLVPFLPLFVPQNTFDHKWSLSSVTVLPLGDIAEATSVVFWLTRESENVVIIGSKTGAITFYSLESQSIVGECKVAGVITDLQICFDDSLDLLTLLVSSTKCHHWKLVLEHRSFGYNWLQQIRAQNDKEKKDSFMSYIRQLSKDKITLFIQGGSKDDNKSQTVEYVLKPTDYLPMFRQGSNNWALTAQYVNGRHFLTAFEMNEGTMILESPEENTPSRTLRPIIKKDGLYIQGLWSQRLIYLVRKNELEVHSANFSVIQGEGLLGTKRDFTQLWSAELIGDVMRAHLMSTKEPPAAPTGWQEPTFMCDLQLPRFSLEPCLIVTTHGAYVLSTMCDPCEWVVGLIMRGCSGAEQSAAGLGASVSPLLRAAADMLMSRGKIAQAQHLYSLSQSQPDGWAARLGVFTRLQELSSYKLSSSFGSLGNSAITLKLLAHIILLRLYEERKFDKSIKFTTLGPVELQELTSFSAAMGLWDLVPVFSIHRGHPNLLLAAIRSRKDICRGALNCLLAQQCLVPILLEENGQWLFDFIAEKCDQFDTIILKRLCLWLNPLQDQLRPVMRDMKQSITTIYTTRMLNLIATFTKVACAVEAREPCPEIHLEVTQVPETWKNQFVPRRALSCGLAHWAVADEGNAKIMLADTPVNTELIGRVIDVACGRHHTLVLTENGMYAAGDNMFGQLGVGRAWGGAAGEAARAGGALLHVPTHWTAPLCRVAAGHYHSAAVDVGGRLYTWGWGVHGQLGLGSIDDHYSPQLVTKLLGRKVVSAACGACHSAALTRGGEVWAFGSGAFGQLGARARKASAPVRVLLPACDPATALAAEYFHNLALTSKGHVWTWGASPQQVRAAAARRANSPSVAPAHPAHPPSGAATPAPAPASAPTSPTSPSPPDPPQDTHLLPHPVDLSNVRGHIVQLSAGWHHSCIMNNFGTIYGWGLNFDGQLGTGDRKQVQHPVEVKIRTDSQPDTVKNTNAKSSEVENKDFKTKALVACGGDFTIYIDDDGRIYNSGNTHLVGTFERDKSGNRVIMMKTTKRIIKIPANRNNNKFMFQPIDRIDIMFPFDIDDLQRKPIEPQLNPLTSFKDFTTTSWADDVLLLLKSWINEINVTGNQNMAAKLAYHNNLYPECLRLLLGSLKGEIPEDRFYITHSEIPDNDKITKESEPSNIDAIKMSIRSIIAKRIKDISITILNEEPYPSIDPAIYQAVACCCDENKYIKRQIIQKFDTNEIEEDMSVKAANIIDKCVGIFPVDTDLWEACFCIAKDFYVENKLSICELERILRKYMESHPATMAGAILYSTDCAQYSEILSPKFYLNMCSQVLDSWG